MAKSGPKTIDPIVRFNKKYIVNPDTGCWEWIGCSNNKGYGYFYILNKNIYAHRFSYEYYIGKLKTGYEICHECNNPKCVNYKHLRQDTHKSNMFDMLKIGNHKNQILSVDQVIQIKKELQNYYHGQVKDLAHFYKVSNRTISHIKTGINWSHIEI